MAVRRESRIDMDLLEIPKDDLELDKKIGRGSFGEVYKCHWRGTTIAVKVLTDQAMNSDTLEEFRTGANCCSSVAIAPATSAAVVAPTSTPATTETNEIVARRSLKRRCCILYSCSFRRGQYDEQGPASKCGVINGDMLNATTLVNYHVRHNNRRPHTDSLQLVELYQAHPM